MRRFLTFSALLIAPILNTYSQESGVFAFQGVNVLPMDGRDVLRDQTVIVRDSRIETIGAAAETDIPQGAERIDGSGRYLVPGLTEMHAHLPGAAERQYLEEVLFLFVANGITTIRVMQPGDPFYLELRDDLIPDREVLGPRIYTGGPTLLGRRVESPEAARRMVFEQAEAGYDFIKMHAGLTPDKYDAAVEAAKEVGIAFAGHVAPAVGIERALAAGQASLEHLDSYVEYMLPDDVDLSETPAGFYGINVVEYVDEAKIVQAARATREAGAWVCPTLTWIANMGVPMEELLARPHMAYVPTSVSSGWVRARGRYETTPELYTLENAPRHAEIRARLVRAMRDEGVPLLLGSDTPLFFNVPGFALHDEIDSLLAAGLTPNEVLRSGTVNPAVFLEAETEFGRIAPGLSADLLLVESDPTAEMETLRRPLGVMLRGQWLERETIDARLEALAAQYAAEPEE